MRAGLVGLNSGPGGGGRPTISEIEKIRALFVEANIDPADYHATR